jgi:hypothetical protein
VKRFTALSVFNFYYWEIYPYILPIVYPIAMMAQTGSAYMTLCVTFERYLVVCWPLKARHLCTLGRAKLAVVIFAIFAVGYNVPRFFEMTYVTKYVHELGMNKTVFEATELRKEAIYSSVYVTWMYFVFMYIIPFASLAVFNLLIFLAIRKVADRSHRRRFCLIVLHNTVLYNLLLTRISCCFHYHSHYKTS